MSGRLKQWLVFALFLGTAVYAIAEDITLTTYYPSPRGVYQELKTAGDMVVGDITNPPAARLHVVQEGTAPALRVDDAPGGDTSPFLIDQSGNVGIGTVSPSFKLDVNGIVNGTDIYKGGVPFSTVPSGAVMSFALASCPAGWSLYAPAIGRYVVGASSSVGSTVGTALSNGENRPTGVHTHTTDFPIINDQRRVTWQGAAGGGYPAYVDIAPYGLQEPNWWGGVFSGDPGVITIEQAGSIADTPAPYIQLLVCQKN